MITANSTPSYLLISAHHDYRMQRRSSIHFIANELAKRGTTRFFSMRYSLPSSANAYFVPHGQDASDGRTRPILSWSDVTHRLLQPQTFADTRLHLGRI